MKLVILFALVAIVAVLGERYFNHKNKNKNN